MRTGVGDAGFVSIAPFRIYGSDGPGFSGPQYAPMVVGNRTHGGSQQGQQQKYGPPLRVENLDTPAGITAPQAEAGSI